MLFYYTLLQLKLKIFSMTVLYCNISLALKFNKALFSFVKNIVSTKTNTVLQFALLFAQFTAASIQQ